MTTKFKRYGFETNARASNETIQKVRNLESEGLGTMEISRMLGIHPSTVRKYRLSRSISSLPPISEELQNRIRELRQAGLSTTDICKQVGVSRPTVIKYGGNAKRIDWDAMTEKISELEKQGIFRRKAQAQILGVHYNTLLVHFGPDRWSSVTTKEILEIRARAAKGEYAREIALDYGCSESTIYSVINRQGRYAHI